eukprot:TRINITY_DN3516_c0_g1_i1.p1 TRINITY_DN3516_c0_g1~~TRINITY_DN3516_c0_g1_i1.p1  ORF type:complete len:255 (+),score=66.51 TRINITY_DN3516_c0_g1_i1:54-818(+)
MKTAALMILMAMVSGAEAGAKAKLTYFDVRGLAQSARLLLSHLKIDTEEVRHTKDTWADAKKAGVESGLFSFGQIPALEYWDANGVKTEMVQSTAIMQFLGREHNMYGKSQADAVLIDVLIGGVGDLRKKYGAFAYNKEVPTKPELIEEYITFATNWIPNFEKLLAKREGTYLCGDDLSIADIMLFDVIDTCVLRVKPTALEGLPKLQAHFDAVRELPGILSYITSDKNHKHANGASAFWDTPTNIPSHLRDEL